MAVSILSNGHHEDFLSLVEENKALKAIIRGATMTIVVGEAEKKQLSVSQLLNDLTVSNDVGSHGQAQDSKFITSAESFKSTVPTVVPSSAMAVVHNEEKHNTHHTVTVNGRPLTLTSSMDSRSNASSDQTEKTGSTEQPKFFKTDFKRVLDEKNQWKETADQLKEELEEWKRAALEAQERVESLESEITEVQQRVGGFYYPNEIQANVLGLVPKGPNFRPQPQAEVAELFVTDVEVSGYVQQEKKFLFAIQLTWSDKKRFEIYRRYAEFFTLQHTLLLLFPEEAGKRKSSERIIPSLPTADNVLAIFGATNSKSTVESRLQLIHDYCHTVLLQLPRKISRSPVLYDFFNARPSDKQLESLKRPLHHSMEMSVYPLRPAGAHQGLYVAVANYDPGTEKSNNNSSANKIPLKVRESVRVVKEDDSGWWYVQKPETGECGYVPSAFLKKVGDPSIPDVSIDMGVLGFVTSVIPNGMTPPSGFLPTSGDSSVDIIGMDLKYVAICEYETTDLRQLSFPKDAVIVIIDKSEDGWWFGTYEGREGWVPSTYLDPCSKKEEDEDTTEIVEGQEYVTKTNYTAKDEDEISLPSGVKVEVLEKSFTGWWKVKYRKRIGYAPATMLQLPVSVSAGSPVESLGASLSPTHGLLHSMSGIKKPPPRKKHVTRKARAKTVLVAIEEKEEEHPTLTATTVCDSELKLNPRRVSFKDFFRKGTGDLKNSKPKIDKDRLSGNDKYNSVSKVASLDEQKREDDLANFSVQT